MNSQPDLKHYLSFFQINLASAISKSSNMALFCWNIVIRIQTFPHNTVSVLDFKEIKPVNPKGNQPWIFTGRTDAEAEAPIRWPSDANSPISRKNPDAGKDWRQKEKGAKEDEMVRQHHWQWTWIWANSKRQWRTGESGLLQSMGSQRVGYKLTNEQPQELCNSISQSQFFTRTVILVLIPQSFQGQQIWKKNLIIRAQSEHWLVQPRQVTQRLSYSISAEETLHLSYSHTQRYYKIFIDHHGRKEKEKKHCCKCRHSYLLTQKNKISPVDVLTHSFIWQIFMSFGVWIMPSI